MSGRPKMCPHCGKLVGLDRVCPYCGKDTGSVGARVKVLGRAGSRGGFPVTIGLVIANILAYVLVIAVGGQQPASHGMELFVPDQLTLVRLGLQIPMLVDAGEWWRIVMPIFLHLGLLHLVMNTLVLWVTGRQLESDIGSAAFFFMYVGAGIVGFAASQVVGIGGGGASGAVAGILGCTIVKRRISDGNFRDPVTMQAIQLVVLNAIFGLVVARVNNVAHLGGLLTGAALGVAFGLWQAKAWARPAWLAGAALMGGAVIASVVMMLLWVPPPGLFDEASRENRAMQAVSCAAAVERSLDKTGTTVLPEMAQEAIRCIDEVGAVEPELDRGMATLRNGLQRSLDGRQGGSLAAEREGLARIHGGLSAIEAWLRKNVDPPD